MTTFNLYPKFEDFNVSTRTYIILTNMTIDLKHIFQTLPISDYHIIPKKSGRKKKTAILDPNKDIKPGSIITIENGECIRGVDLKKKKNKKREGKHDRENESKHKHFFRNSVTIVMVLTDKIINFKISSNGKIQMTGCKYIYQAVETVKFLWKHLSSDKLSHKITDDFQAIFIPVMRNIDFNAKFIIDREKIHNYINTETDYISIISTNLGYTGVNIKFPVKHIQPDLKLLKLTLKEDWIASHITWSDYLKILSEKDRKKALKQRENSFLVFHSGMIIMSGMVSETMKGDYDKFIEILSNNRNYFEENLDTSIISDT